MGKIITLYNHKGGVGKTTLVHNIGFALADMGKKVLMIDADPQMNLTSAMYGLSTAVEYSMNEGAKWREYTEQYLSFGEYINQHLKNDNCEKKMFQINSRNNNCGKIDLISGSIKLSILEAELYNIITNKLEITRDIPYRFEQSIRKIAKDYDVVLIDTSPSASSIINGLIIMSSDYYIAPVSPTFFSLQAIDNLGQVIDNWDNLLRFYKTTIGQKGISGNPKFLGLVVQLAKRYNGGAVKEMTGYSKAAEKWIGEVNESVKRFVGFIGRNSSVSEEIFCNIFDKHEPYIIEKCCDYTSSFRDVCEGNGIPVVYLTQDICDDYKRRNKDKTAVNITEDNSQHKRSFESINQSYRAIAEGLTKLL